LLLTGSRFAEQLPSKNAGSSNQICVQTDEGVELWDIAADRQLLSHPIQRQVAVRAFEDGCVALSETSVQLLRQDQAQPLRLAVKGRPTAVAWLPAKRESLFAEGAVLVAAGSGISAFDRNSSLLQTLRASEGVTAIARAGHDALALGYRDGSIELHRPSASSVATQLSFEAVPAAAPTRIVGGPAGTIAVGYANGLVGLWNLGDGTRLASERLHGSVAYLKVSGERLYAASDLGQHLSWDLSTFGRDYCTLMHEVWSSVPVVWSAGRATAKGQGGTHRCKAGLR